MLDGPKSSLQINTDQTFRSFQSTYHVPIVVSDRWERCPFGLALVSKVFRMFWPLFVTHCRFVGFTLLLCTTRHQ